MQVVRRRSVQGDIVAPQEFRKPSCSIEWSDNSDSESDSDSPESENSEHTSSTSCEAERPAQKEPEAETENMARIRFESLGPASFKPVVSIKQEQQQTQTQSLLQEQPDLIINKNTNTKPASAQVVLPSALSSFSLGSLLAAGTHGRVFQASSSAGAAAAIKVIPMTSNGGKESASDLETMARHEVRMLERVARELPAHQHRYLQIQSAQVNPDTNNHAYIVTELLGGRNAFDEDVMNCTNKNEARTAVVIERLAVAVGLLHKIGIVHRDIKCENVVYCSRSPTAMDFKLVDFGSACEFTAEEDEHIINGMSENTPIGTEGYLAPESIKHGQYSPASDVWALGVVLYLLLCHRHPFPKAAAGDSQTRLERIVCGAYSAMDGYAWQNVSSEAKDLVSRILVADPKERMTITELLDHPWVRQRAGHTRGGRRSILHALEPRARLLAGPVVKVGRRVSSTALSAGSKVRRSLGSRKGRSTPTSSESSVDDVDEAFSYESEEGPEEEEVKPEDLKRDVPAELMVRSSPAWAFLSRVPRFQSSLPRRVSLRMSRNRSSARTRHVRDMGVVVSVSAFPNATAVC